MRLNRQKNSLSSRFSHSVLKGEFISFVRRAFETTKKEEGKPMKITKNLTHVVTDVEFEPAMHAKDLQERFKSFGLEGFQAELDISERTEDHVQMLSLDELLGFAKVSGLAALTFDVTYFPHADEKEVTYQLKQLAHDLEISAEVIRHLCEEQIAEYLALDAKRDTSLPVHSIVEAYTGGTAFAWYGMNDYPRLKRVILRRLAEGGQRAKQDFVLKASKAQVDLLDE